MLSFAPANQIISWSVARWCFLTCKGKDMGRTSSWWLPEVENHGHLRIPRVDTHADPGVPAEWTGASGWAWGGVCVTDGKGFVEGRRSHWVALLTWFLQVSPLGASFVPTILLQSWNWPYLELSWSEWLICGDMNLTAGQWPWTLCLHCSLWECF